MRDMDKIIRSKLYDHPSHLPEGLWDMIEEGINEKKKRRFALWYWIGGMGVILILVLGIVQFLSTPQDLSKAQDSISLENVENLKSGAINKKPNLTSQSIVTADKYDSDEDVYEAATILDPDKDIAISLKTNRIDTRAHTEDSKHTSILESKYNSSDKYKAQKSHFGTASTEEKNHKATSLYYDQIAKDREKIDIEKRIRLEGSPNLTIPQSLLVTQDRNFKDPVGCPNFANRYKANLFIETYYQPLHAYSMLSSNSPEIGDNYLDLRRDSERNLYSWSAGINVGWISDYNVGVKAGADYEVINERFTFEDPAAIRNQTIIVIDTTFNTDGSFTVNMDTSVVQVSGAETQRIANHHRSLSIPIHALYHINYKDFALEISGGPIFNINYSNRGKIIDPTNNAQWFTNGESGSYNVYKSRLSVSFSVSFSALYSINENFQLYASPHLKYHPTTISKINSPFNQRYLNTGLALGARYYFSGNPNY